MTKQREGYHNATLQIPTVLWDRLNAEASEQGTSAARVVTAMLAKRYHIAPKDLPAPKRAGRKPKSK